jgi:hypothetical protein
MKLHPSVYPETIQIHPVVTDILKTLVVLHALSWPPFGVAVYSRDISFMTLLNDPTYSFISIEQFY